ncbi:hypothetical protein CIPAW_04G090400 [Carya illinoinensis]|uniref:Uncharacterized protein n=1 Tax=Carya illinoinensis TaxID=32201 RepID=A0A8T1QR90_CARIL|nr:hypothetical protein CIPAW_04G090400 [Carya illinoinensis]
MQLEKVHEAEMRSKEDAYNCNFRLTTKRSKIVGGESCSRIRYGTRVLRFIIKGAFTCIRGGGAGHIYPSMTNPHEASFDSTVKIPSKRSGSGLGGVI